MSGFVSIGEHVCHAKGDNAGLCYFRRMRRQRRREEKNVFSREELEKLKRILDKRSKSDDS